MLNKLDIPILQAPMLGVSTPALAAAVSNAGGLGAVAMGALAPDDIRQLVVKLRALTAEPFGINLFVVRQAAVDQLKIEKAIARLVPWRQRYALEKQGQPAAWFADFDAQLQTVIELRPAVASFTFGCLTSEEVTRLHQSGIYVIGTATTAGEARAWQDTGADALCLQGEEAGGHRGSFTPEDQLAPVPLMELIVQARKATSIPVIAAGGLMTGVDIGEALKTGANAAQLGTAFMLCPEASTSAPWRKELKLASSPTRLTRVFSGRYARGIVNKFMDDMADIEADLPDYPVQNILTGDLRAACAKSGSSDCLSLWAGMHYNRLREMPAAELLKTLWQEANS